MTALAIIAAQPLPSSIDAELDLIGIALFDNGALARLGEPVSPEAFSAPLHARIWEIITRLISQGRLAEPTALHERLKGDPDYEASGALSFLASRVDAAPNPALIANFADRVNDAARRREIIRIAGEAMQAARDIDLEPVAVMAETERQLAALAVAAAPDDGTQVDAHTSVHATIDSLERDRREGRVLGRPTGLRCFDKRLGGLKPNKLTVIGGRPSMGKTGLCRRGALGCAQNNPDDLVLYYTIEMLRAELDARTLSQLSFEAGRPFKYQDIESDHERVDLTVLHGFRDLAQRVPSNLIVDDSSTLSLDHIRRRSYARANKRRVAAIFIDYLQIMQRPIGRQSQNDASIIQTITQGLKQLAGDLGCSVVLLSQLSRNLEQRENKRPMLSDLRESGAIEQDADNVLFVYREHYYLQREGPSRGTTDAEHALKLAEVETRMEVICAKQRGGPVGTDVQRYLAPYDVIENEGDWT